MVAMGTDFSDLGLTRKIAEISKESLAKFHSFKLRFSTFWDINSLSRISSSGKYIDILILSLIFYSKRYV